MILTFEDTAVLSSSFLSCDTVVRASFATVSKPAYNNSTVL